MVHCRHRYTYAYTAPRISLADVLWEAMHAIGELLGGAFFFGAIIILLNVL